MSTETSPRNLPSKFRAVHAVGDVSAVSLADDYRPAPGRRIAFSEELEKLAAAEREELLASADVRL